MSLKAKMEQIALKVADALLDDGVDLVDRIDGLKTLSGYYATVKRAEAGERTTQGRWSELAVAVGGEKHNGHAELDDEE